MILGSYTHLFFFSFRAGRYDSTDRHCKRCVGFRQINRRNKGAFPVVITRAQYKSIQNYRTSREDSEGGKQATGQSTEEANVQIRMVLADVFKGGFPDWFPVTNLEAESSGSGAIMNDTAQPPTNTTSAVVPFASSFEQLPLYEPSPFNPDSANGSAEALKNGFPVINLEGESNDSGAVMDASAQLSAMPVSVPVANQFNQTPRYELSLFDPETANECAEALKNGLPAINREGESNVAQPSISVAVPTAAQSEFYMPPIFDLERVDEWGPLLSGFA